MSDIKDNLRRLVLSLSEDEVHAVLAIVQSSRVEETGDVTCGTVPDGLTKADCKRLIKTMREKQSAAPCICAANWTTRNYPYTQCMDSADHAGQEQ